MKKLAIVFTLIAIPFQCSALTMSDYLALRDAARAGDVMANRLIESYLNGLAEGVLASHSASPISGICINSKQPMRTTDVIQILADAERHPEIKGRDFSRLAVAPVFIQGLRQRFRCR